MKLFIRIEDGQDKYCVDDGGNGLNEQSFNSKGEAIGFIIDWWTNKGNI